MLDRSMFLSLNFYKKEPFQGSYKGLRYQLQMITVEEDKKLEVVIWPEPYCITATPDEKKQTMTYSFDDDGLEQAIAWMNEMHETIKNLAVSPLD